MNSEPDTGHATRTSPRDVVAVTVTYGDRWQYLEPVLRSLLDQDVGEIIVVDNGSAAPIGPLAHDVDSQRIQVVDMQDNTGSAGGFAAGLRKASTSDCKYIWLLDDDNLPAADALSRLLDIHSAMGGDANNVLLGFRHVWKEQRKAVSSGTGMAFVRNSFLGFHIKGIPRIAVRGLSNAHEQPEDAGCPLVRVGYAPYGGLLFSRAWIDRVGYPNESMYLYFDDHEYTARMARDGGNIYLFAGARIEDIDTSWARGRVSSHYWVSPASDEKKIFYGMRNGVYLHYQQVTSRFMWYLNMSVALAAFALLGLVMDRKPVFLFKRMSLIAKAIRAGQKGLLGRVD